MGKRGHGEGSIHKRKDGRWCAQVDLGFVVTEDGSKRKRVTLYGKTRAEAQAKLQDTLQKRKQGAALDKGRPTFSRFLAEWLSSRHSIRDTTRERYRVVIEQHVIPQLGRLRLDQITGWHLQQYITDKLAEGQAPSTVNVHMKVVRAAVRDAVRLRLIVVNPMEGVRFPAYTHRDLPQLDGRTLQRLLAACDQHMHGPVFRLALATGLRLGELLGLRWADVTLDSMQLTVRHTVHELRGALRSGQPPKTKGSMRTVSIPPSAVQMLRTVRQNQARNRIALGSVWVDYDLVFAGTRGQPLFPSCVRKAWSRLLKAAGLPHLRLHDLRHAHASLLIAQGEPLLVVSRRLGHSSIAVTADVYGHLQAGMDQKAAEQFDRWLAPADSVGSHLAVNQGFTARSRSRKRLLHKDSSE